MNTQRAITSLLAAILSVAVVCASPARADDSSCAGDLTGDGVVDGLDLLILLSAWGVCGDPNDCPADLNDDGSVDGLDLLILLANWGDCPGLPPGTVYTELNYIDPPGNECPEGLCTNGIGGVLFGQSNNTHTFYTPAAIWTQSQAGFFHGLRVIVYGVESFSNPEPKTTWEEFTGFDYRVHIWEDFASYAASPKTGTHYVSGIIEPVNENKGTPIGYSQTGIPTFEWEFDFSQQDIALEEGKEYVVALIAHGSPELHGVVLRQLSSWEMGPDVHASNMVGPGFMDQPPHSFDNPRLGTEIRVRTK